MNRINTFIKSLFWHISKGCPKSSAFLIKQRYDICRQCSQFDGNKHICLECGCNINNKKQFMNKLAWLDQKCPLGKW